MAPTPWSTHTIEFSPDTVTKRFGRDCQEQCAREWRALTLLAVHAPGTGPEPVAVDFDATEPVVVMSRLEGEPLRGQDLNVAKTEALARTVDKLHTAVPTEKLASIPQRPGQQQGVREYIKTWTPRIRPEVGGQVARAMDEGLAWLARTRWEDSDGQLVPSAFGPGDGNLANYLWDGSCVRVVDFEDFGRSDRPFELAEITEHVGSWVESPLDAEDFLARCDLTRAERSRLLECRRLLALVWLLLLCRDVRGDQRNPEGTVDRQAERLSELLV